MTSQKFSIFKPPLLAKAWLHPWYPYVYCLPVSVKSLCTKILV